MTMNYQLLAVNNCARRSRDPGEWQLRQTGHLIAPGTQKMDVVACALAGDIGLVAAESPGSIHALNPVQQALALQGLERPVYRHPVETGFAFSLVEDIVM